LFPARMFGTPLKYPLWPVGIREEGAFKHENGELFSKVNMEGEVTADKNPWPQFDIPGCESKVEKEHIRGGCWPPQMR
jgi:hypothetical protein